VTGAKLDFTGPQKDKVLSTWARKVLACLKLLAKLLTGCLSTLQRERLRRGSAKHRRGIGKSGRSMSDFDVGAYTAFSVGPDLAKARKSAKMVAALLRWALRACARAHGIPLGTAKSHRLQLSEAVKWGEVGPLVTIT